VEAIRLDARGVAWIGGTRTKVIQVVLDHIVHGWSSAEIHDQYPHLSPRQIANALAYYEEHQAQLDAEIRSRYDRVERMRSQATGQFTREELEVRLRDRHQDKSPAS
jgi:uncharacterized protein (DUF433 family)